jgi:hypothetical protein
VAAKEGGSGFALLTRPDVTYYEHSAEVMAVAAATELDLIASAARDGTIVLRSLRGRQYIRSILHPACEIPDVVSVQFTELVLCASNGAIVSAAVVTSSAADAAPYTTFLMHSINGRLLSESERISERVRLCAGGGQEALGWAAGRQTELLIGLEGSEVAVRDLHERPMHDLVRFQTQVQLIGGLASASPSGLNVRHRGTVPKATCLVLLQCGPPATASAGSQQPQAERGALDGAAGGMGVSQLFVGLSNGQVLRQQLGGVLPRLLTSRGQRQAGGGGLSSVKAFMKKATKD